MPDVNYHHVVKVSSLRMSEAKTAARELRAMFDALAPIEKMVAAKQIAAVRRLVEAVEAL
ncbi:hypothetical protein [Burkholderia ubonensis]|uniref:hypothetical protein n=1 Tax=Burkholderia ubonensis TaxID=101571 RepID=UPI00075E631A|nr:hypothetical protein [Burkholderia ubonensis]KVD37929.1 hypothetical protein WI83_05920 [Burkholderia ubonensis]